MQNNGIVFAALIVIVLMSAVIVVQQEQIQRDNNVVVELISYSGNDIVKVDHFQHTLNKSWIGVQTDSEYIRENNITVYGFSVLKDN